MLHEFSVNSLSKSVQGLLIVGVSEENEKGESFFRKRLRILECQFPDKGNTLVPDPLVQIYLVLYISTKHHVSLTELKQK